MKNKLLILFVCLLILMKVPLCAQDTLLSPKDFGLYETVSDSERYQVLYNTHVAALKAGVPVDYSGIDTLTIEITASSQRIPLGKTTDFKGLRLSVRNKSKLCYLFERQQTATGITIDKALLDGEQAKRKHPRRNPKVNR